MTYDPICDAMRTLCRGRLIFDADGMRDWDCSWLLCPVLWAGDPCPNRLEDDNRSLPPLGMDRVVVDATRFIRHNANRPPVGADGRLYLNQAGAWGYAR
jgi:hypothetical protein